MEKKLSVELQMEATEGGLKELVLRWFTETQAALIQKNNGNFPDWFQGFATRKDAEDLLRDKALGCFLIRLSDKAIGYILSYKGYDRCRHFVITQNQDGHFVISGDCQTYHSLTELIDHYKDSPIQPFGEYLTSSCNEENTGELYDVVNYNQREKEKYGVSVQALRTLWDKKNDHHSSNNGRSQMTPQKSQSPTGQLPTLPLKSKSRKLTGTMSVDPESLLQGVPPVPKRAMPLGLSHSGSLPETTSHPNDETELNKLEILQGDTAPALMTDINLFNAIDKSYSGDLCPPGTTYSELAHVESRSKSLPQLDNNNMEDEYSNHLNNPSISMSMSSTSTKKVTCHTYSLHDPGSQKLNSSRSEQLNGDPEMLRSNPLYQSSPQEPERSLAQQGDGTYTEVSQRPTPNSLPDDTYEQIPGETTATIQGNTYESLDDLKTKKSKSTWGKGNIKWKKYLPDYKKK